jgi:ferric-dicitrate binding protein FerR (iron transport regulator)
MATENKLFNPKKLAHKYEQGTLTAIEKAWFEEWYAGFNDEEVLLSGSKHTSANDIKAHIFHKLSAEIGTPATPKVKVVLLWRQIAAVAAILLLIASATFYKNNILNVIEPVRQIELSSNSGRHRQVKLPDGTQVWLSPFSRISYPDQFRTAQRIVKLEGEAFFEVVHDARHPFIIQSGEIKTTVLGTSFNVQAYPNATHFEVTVVSGKVAVAISSGDKFQQQVMVTNERALFNKQGNSLVKEAYPAAAKFIDQRSGLFNYEGATLQTVVDELQQQYNIQIVLSKNLSGKAFYGQLKTTDAAERTLDKLSSVMDAKWFKTGNTYHLQQQTQSNY